MTILRHRHTYAFLLAAIFLLSPMILAAQYSVKGMVKNTRGEPLDYVTVVIYQNPKSIIRSAITDKKGQFSINFDQSYPDSLTLAASRIGYITALIKIKQTAGEKAMPVMDVILNDDIKSMKAVNIVSEKQLYERKNDRFVFNIENSILANGSNAFEGIGKTPGMIANANGISMIGKGAVKVLVNGRDIRLSGDDLTNYLTSLPSESIKAIEVITSPGAKYDANGDSGIVNIILKKNKNEGLIISETSSYEQRKNPSEAQNVNFNYRRGKVNLYGFTNINHFITVPEENTNIYFPQSIWSTSNVRNTKRTTSSFQLGLDINISKKSFLSLLSEGSLYNHTDENADVQTNIFNRTSSLIDSVQLLNNQIQRTGNYKDYDVNYTLAIDTIGSSLSVNFDYLSNTTAQYQNLTSYAYAKNALTGSFANSSQSPQEIESYVGKIDIEKKLPKDQLLSIGAKFTNTQTINNYAYFDYNKGTSTSILNTAKSNYFIYKETIAALYASYNKDWNKYSFQLGLRGELSAITAHSITLGTLDEQDYFKVFPSLFIMRSINNDNRINFNYNIRINRPAYWELNPFKYFTSAYSFAEGNPNLKPAYTHNFQLVYTYKNKYFFTAYVQIEKDHFQQVPVINADSSYYYYNRLNIGNITTYGLICFIPVKVSGFWNMNAQMNVFGLQQSTTYLNKPLEYNKLSCYANISNQFFLNGSRNLYSELNFTYNSSKQVFLNRSDAFYYLDFGIKRSFKNGAVGINVFDLFKTLPYTVRVNYYTQNSDLKNNFESRFLRLSLTYKLGKQTVKDKKNRQLGNSEEKNRVN
jgi:hypothetical protein